MKQKLNYYTNILFDADLPLQSEQYYRSLSSTAPVSGFRFKGNIL